MPDDRYLVTYTSFNPAGPMITQIFQEQSVPEKATPIDIVGGQSRLDIHTRLVASPKACVVPELIGSRLVGAGNAIDDTTCELRRRQAQEEHEAGGTRSDAKARRRNRSSQEVAREAGGQRRALASFAPSDSALRTAALSASPPIRRSNLPRLVQSTHIRQRAERS